jgi:hypothetical protein
MGAPALLAGQGRGESRNSMSVVLSRGSPGGHEVGDVVVELGQARVEGRESPARLPGLLPPPGPGEFLNEPVGVIQPGRYADLAILGGDPLTDIRAAADVRQVMVNGALHSVDALLAPYAEPALPAAAAPSRLLPPVPEHPGNRRYWWHDPHYVQSSRHACCTEA